MILTIRDMHIRRGEGAHGLIVQLPELTLSAGDVVAITGASGCGKSTLLEMIGLLLRPDGLTAYQLGRPVCDVADLWRTSQHDVLSDLRAREVGFVLQQGGLLPYLTVAQNLYLPARMRRLAAPNTWLEASIERLGLTRLLNKLPASLSIGERQRVAFARALAHQPRVLLADEPTSALDPVNARNLFALMLDMVKAFSLAAVIVSHDLDRVNEWGLRCIHGDTRGGTSVFRFR
ncbi:ABC transporter ATP-binding protein [Dickeya solani]|uniref:ABC transporter ATP-binding protein n=1 Tax=Dickeya solani TaxID=1089444 RepID=A0ABU4EJZ2_9GAMM|nr:ABC transporter ATP-binding protein [Dickeya solani]MCA6999740.1 ABC transporter ATP-binding protein [Dickeya solani]MCZ0820315.1 ABC transporter ATP-binding protein [Dickeya solani]MDV6993951.1 ABC transporter ATP-binding protein [Dickeya solani]MDV7005307.1 ABC transporter ATP-binding protein [Dickeya solani]MDV7039124.1 ABC transporter ATP-binding protein [Dickeya solani]